MLGANTIGLQRRRALMPIPVAGHGGNRPASRCCRRSDESILARNRSNSSIGMPWRRTAGLLQYSASAPLGACDRDIAATEVRFPSWRGRTQFQAFAFLRRLAGSRRDSTRLSASSCSTARVAARICRSMIGRAGALGGQTRLWFRRLGPSARESSAMRLAFA